MNVRHVSLYCVKIKGEKNGVTNEKERKNNSDKTELNEGKNE